MFLKKTFIKKTGRTNLAIVQGYRNKAGKPRHKIVQSIGYLDEFTDQYDDPVAHFKQRAIDMTAEQKKRDLPVALSISPQSSLPVGTDNRKNFGHVAFSNLYHELELDYFINNRRRYTKAEYNHNAIFKLLVYGRLLQPSSKKKAFERGVSSSTKWTFP